MKDRPEISYTFVDTPAPLETLSARLKQTNRVALDIEGNSLHRYFEKVCLIQLTFDGENYILDPLAGLDLSRFLRVLSATPLILHDADYDLRMLHSSLGFRPRREVFDTMLAGQILGCTQYSLVALARDFLEVSLTKRGQKSDWTQRPLTKAQLR
ncbi:unnamed protein product, partial [marine sediment metagenome]